MLVPNINNLPSKFQQFLINPKNSPRTELLEDIEKELKGKSLTKIKDYIFEGDKWIFKSARSDDLLTTPDTHLYRVRKAEKIRSYLNKNKLTDHIAVPKKHIYWDESENRFYVVAEKLELSKRCKTCK